MESIFINIENSKANEQHKLRSSNKYVSLKTYLFNTRGKM